MNATQQAALRALAAAANAAAVVLTAGAWWLRCRAIALQPTRIEELSPRCLCHNAWHLLGQPCPTSTARA